MRIARLTAVLAVLLLAFGGTSAYAQTAPKAGYDETLGVIGEIQSEDPPRNPTVERQDGDLPFTGLDLGIVALMGAALVGTGLVLRRTTRRGPAG
jgi:hypothetical protein